MRRKTFGRSTGLVAIVLMIVLAFPLVSQADTIVNNIDVSPDSTFEIIEIGDGQTGNVTLSTTCKEI